GCEGLARLGVRAQPREERARVAPEAPGREIAGRAVARVGRERPGDGVDGRGGERLVAADGRERGGAPRLARAEGLARGAREIARLLELDRGSGVIGQGCVAPADRRSVWSAARSMGPMVARPMTERSNRTSPASRPGATNDRSRTRCTASVAAAGS